ncbi:MULTISPECIES: restriction endonuclease [Brevundimonas]|uniref:restriction endonuclease n=1 Tax=Brevundimonas TaxID=41275 RepID=UPI000207F5A3|nr:hypothetical protein [Brevundimonas]EGF95691.1 hypothetical protein BDIM_25330 [Brevundimonas diminuta ATCC 11568]OWR21118.1 hypothetical protein CD944_05360 [Brevundimonas diminuta]RSB46619.1 hypothetical protein EGK63_06560 [Brevundimonas sp. 357]WQE45500.1 hypothetical protein U0020_01260 [Brevundimonas diminuta]SUW14714.1 Uncharacterised protein [Brevundimonas diminuta]
MKTIDLDEVSGPFAGIQFDTFEETIVAFTIGGLGSSNSHLDIAAYLFDAVWAVEKLAGYAAAISYRREGYFGRKLLITVREPKLGFGRVLDDVSLRMALDDEDPDPTLQSRIDAIDAEISELEDTISERVAKCPDIVDWYLSNLVLGANYEWRSESPEYVRQQFADYPERRFGYFRSAHSTSVGASCFAGEKGWLLPAGRDLDVIFDATGQKCRMAEFLPATFVQAGGTETLCVAGQAAPFPMAAFLQGAGCIDAVQRDGGDVDDEFDPPRTLELIRFLQGRSRLWLHASGALALVEGQDFHQLLLIDAQPVRSTQLVKQAQAIGKMQSRLLEAGGLGQSIQCAWGTLTDDEFEELCYDIVRLHPKIDAERVRKMGKSRSRDGGRDIVAFERRSSAREQFKWIFQCKLVSDGRSLGGTRLTDIGDMLDQYEANGFGVMTSALIDATLYDKIDALCSRRSILRRDYSVLELERELHARPDLRARYFA